MEPTPINLDGRQVSVLLRGEPELLRAWAEQWNLGRLALCVGVIFTGAGLYGAAMGYWRDPLQALFVAIKFPLIILLTTLGNALLNAMLAPLLGLNLNLRQSFLAILMSFTIAAAILGAFSPLVAFMVWNAPPMSPDVHLSGGTYSLIQLTHVAVIAFAGLAGNVRLFQLLRLLGGNAADRAAGAVRLARGESVSRQPALLDFAAVHRLAAAAGGVSAPDGVPGEFLRGRVPLHQAFAHSD